MRRYEAKRVGVPQQPPQENSISCFCCRDTALIAAEVVRKYLIPDYNDQRFFPQQPDAPVLCTRRVCQANSVLVTLTDSESKGTYTKLVKRFALNAVDAQISPEDCDWVHQQELAEFKRANQQPFVVAEAIAQISQKHQIKASPWDKVARNMGVVGGQADG